MFRWTALLVAVISLAICAPAFADMDTSNSTAPGNIVLGGAVSFSSTDSENLSERTTNWTMAPSLRYFVADNMSIGLVAMFEALSQGSVGISDHRYMAMGQYVVPMEGTMRPWFQAGGGFARNTVEGGTNLVFNGWSIAAGAGMYMFINEHVSITPQVSYIYSSYSDDGTAVRGTDQTVFVSLGINGFMLP